MVRINQETERKCSEIKYKISTDPNNFSFKREKKNSTSTSYTVIDTRPKMIYFTKPVRLSAAVVL